MTRACSRMQTDSVIPSNLFVVYFQGFSTAGRGSVCEGVHEGGSNLSPDLLCGPEGRTLFRRMQTCRLMDGRSDRFPGLIFTREIVIHPKGEAEERPGPLFCSALIFSWKQDAMKRLRAQLWPCSEERWSKSLAATAVPSPDCTEMCMAGHIWCN